MGKLTEVLILCSWELLDLSTLSLQWFFIYSLGFPVEVLVPIAISTHKSHLVSMICCLGLSVSLTYHVSSVFLWLQQELFFYTVQFLFIWTQWYFPSSSHTDLVISIWENLRGFRMVKNIFAWFQRYITFVHLSKITELLVVWLIS